MRAAVLDVNETLFALDEVGEALDGLGLPHGALDLWFARILRDGFAVAAMGGLVGFPDLARHHVDVLARRAGVVLGDDDVDEVVHAFDRVEAHPDVVTGLRRLADGGLRLATFTNGSASIVQHFLERTGVDDLVEVCEDVAAAGAWKPAPASYAWICERLDVPAAEVAMVAVHPWDVAGAMRASMVGAWLNRDHALWPGWYAAPDRSAGSLVELAGVLTAP